MNDYVHVAVGVVKNAHGQVLLARRAEHAHQGGLWEFPGGKVEVGETVQQALCRELNEELGITIGEEAEPLIQIRHQYSDKNVFLDVWVVQDYKGSPSGREGQPLTWVTPKLLLTGDEFTLPSANTPIVAALNLPHSMLVTGAVKDQQDFRNKLRNALGRGVKLVQARVPYLSLMDQEKWLGICRQECQDSGAMVVCNARDKRVFEFEADGYHISSQLLTELSERPVSKSKWLGASCHSLSEMKQAEKIDVDYITLSPVTVTASHVDVKPLGWDLFAGLVAQVNIPVFALGGMAESDLLKSRSLGGHGIAAIREFWR